MRRFLVRLGGLLLCAGLVGASARPALGFPIELSDEVFGPSNVTPSFSAVRNFAFSIELEGSIVPGARYGNAAVLEVQYLVSGGLSTSPPTPSGFPAFTLDRRPGGEGPISPGDWVGQGSTLAFEVSPTADLADGLQLSELVPGEGGVILEIDAREFERLDRARYHPPQLVLFANGTGVLRNSNNSSGSTGTTNPATGQTVDLDFGDEYVTQLAFAPGAITLAVPEPSSGLLLALGLVVASIRRRGGQEQAARGVTPARR